MLNLFVSEGRSTGNGEGFCTEGSGVWNVWFRKTRHVSDCWLIRHRPRVVDGCADPSFFEACCKGISVWMAQAEYADRASGIMWDGERAKTALVPGCDLPPTPESAFQIFEVHVKKGRLQGI